MADDNLTPEQKAQIKSRVHDKVPYPIPVALKTRRALARRGLQLTQEDMAKLNEEAGADE